MKIAIANDHAAGDAKHRVRARLEGLGHEVRDLGTHDDTSTDYPDYAHALAQLVQSGEVDRGVLLCGTGIGMSIAANRHRGVRAALCHSAETAEMTRLHNDANVLCLGARVLDGDTLDACVDAFFGAVFEGGRHRRRVEKIELARDGGNAARDEGEARTQEKEL